MRFKESIKWNFLLKNELLASFFYPFYDICHKTIDMGMNKNTILGWATFIMTLMGFLLIGLGIFKYSEISGWGFAAVGIGFFAIAWVFNALKGRV